jgi:ketosteroid isomerase-like protein
VTQDDVLAAARRRAEALSSGEPDELRRWLHEDFVWTSHRGEVFDRAAYLEANTRRLRWVSQELVDPQVTVVGDTAIVVAAVHDVVERDGEPLNFTMRLTQTWIRSADGWQCLAGHAGPLAPGSVSAHEIPQV